MCTDAARGGGGAASRATAGARRSWLASWRRAAPGCAVVLALFVTGILPSVGFSPALPPPQAGGCCGHSGPAHWRRRCGARAARMALSERGASRHGGAPAWPSVGESTPPVHVKISEGASSRPDVGELGSLVPPVGKKAVADFTVNVNDKQCRPLRSGYYALRAASGGESAADAQDGARFALTGDLRLPCPSYMHLLPPVAGESIQRLWVTSFGMARAGSVVGIDLTGKLPARRLRTEFVWPNAVEHVPAEFLAPLFGEGFDVTASVLVADGFLVPGKTDGGVFLVQNPGGAKEMPARLSRQDDSRWFYHRAIPFELQGHKGVLTARALKPLSPFQPAQGQLVWMEAPNATNPLAPWNLPWREVVLAEGPDVMFEVVDLDVTDDTVEVFAPEFFAQRLTMHSLKWCDEKGAPCVVQREVIDDSLGQAYSVAVADVEGPMSHLLVTTHEYLPVPAKGGLRLGSAKWSYMSDSMAPRESPEVNGGSLFAYRIPINWRQRSDGYIPAVDTYKKMLPEMFRRIDCDNSGEISVDELEASLSWLKVEVDSEDLRKAFDNADWDGSGTIEYQEFEDILLAIRRMPEGSKRNPLGSLSESIGDTLRSTEEALKKGLPTVLQQIRPQVPQVPPDLQQVVSGDDAGMSRADLVSRTDLEVMLRKIFGDESYSKQPSVTTVFEALDSDKDGLLTPAQVRELCITVWKDSNSSRNVWGLLARALESVLSRGTMRDEDLDAVSTWTRTTLATGFSVKRAGINPGAPGFVYPFYPHKSMRRASQPPHLLVAGDCSDAAYIFRPVRSETKSDTIFGPWVETGRKGVIDGKKGGGQGAQFLYPGQPAQVNLDFRYPVTTGDTGRVRYELVATFGCEGTVGSVAVGNVDTVQSFDDGWVKFFLPVYEKDRVYMLKCGDSPTMGYLDDDDW